MTDKWKLKTASIDLPLAERFTIARESWDFARNVFAAVSYEGVTGHGEGEPDARWGETPNGVVAALEALDLGQLASPFDLEGVTALLPAGTARAALDIALHDVAAKLAGVPLAHFLGLGGRAIPPTSVTVPIANLGVMLARAERLGDYPVLKLKVGFDGDVEVVEAIRRVYDGTIRIDANEGWSASEAIDRLERMGGLDIELCEQPVHGDDLAGLKDVHDGSPIPIFADEAACTAADVVRLAGHVHGVNLKLRKCGGIREFIRAAAVARAAGLGVMIGCNLESGVASTAAASVACLADFVDIDAPLLLAEDPFPGVTYDGARMRLPTGAGLGLLRRPEL
jgi:L-Ala-D/L-Glu epimerase